MKFVHDMAIKDANRTSGWTGLAYPHRKGEYVWNNGESFNSSVSVGSATCQELFMKINASKS